MNKAERLELLRKEKEEARAEFLALDETGEQLGAAIAAHTAAVEGKETK